MDRRQNVVLYVIVGVFGSVLLFFLAISEQRFGGSGKHHAWSPTAEQKKAYKARHARTHH